MPDLNFDLKLFGEAKEYGLHLKAQNSRRNAMMDQMEKMLHLDWDEEAKVKRTMKDVKLTKSPVARNKLLGAARLLSVVDPVWRVGRDKNDASTEDAADKLEKWAAAVWSAASQVKGEPIHYDAALSILTFGQVHIAVTNTAHLLEQAKGAPPAAMARAEQIAAATPFMFDVWDPRPGYPDLTDMGLQAYYREVDVSTGYLEDTFGDLVTPILKRDGNTSRYKTKKLCQLWDGKYRQVWLDSIDRPLLQEEPGQPFIPISVGLGEGSRLFTAPERQGQPFLYTLWKSELWARQNLILTVLYTLAMKVGASPLMLYKRNGTDKHLELDLSRPFGIAEIDNDEELTPLLKAVIDPSIMDAWQIATSLGEESTIYGQTLGQPLGGSATFSTTALLHQAGRLPLVLPQRKAGAALAGAMRIALEWTRLEGKKSKVDGGSFMAELRPTEIPKRYNLEANLEISLPQDELQNAQLAQMISTGEEPIASKAWARENIMRIGQSEQMTQEIWNEKAAELFYRLFMDDQVKAIQQAQAAMQNQPVPGAPGTGQGQGQVSTEEPPGAPPGMMPAGVTPEQIMNGGQAPMNNGAPPNGTQY